MIKAEDLRIGDLVKINENCSLKEGVISYITEIRTRGIFEKEDCVKVKHFDSDWEFGVWCCNIDPIPLTSEILEKNGWKYISHKGLPWALFRKKDCSVRIAYDSEEDKAPFSVGKEIQELKNINYVHELQHFLWVLGEDANLKI